MATGAAAFKGKLHAFNQVLIHTGKCIYNLFEMFIYSFIYFYFLRVQNISQQVASYMRDPSRMIKRMQLRRPMVGLLGEVSFLGLLEICF